MQIPTDLPGFNEIIKATPETWAGYGLLVGFLCVVIVVQYRKHSALEIYNQTIMDKVLAMNNHSIELFTKVEVRLHDSKEVKEDLRALFQQIKNDHDTIIKLLEKNPKNYE